MKTTSDRSLGRAAEHASPEVRDILIKAARLHIKQWGFEIDGENDPARPFVLAAETAWNNAARETRA